MGTESKYYNRILEKLEKLCKKESIRLAVTGLQLFVVIVLSVFILFSLIELAANLNSTVRTILFYLSVAFFVVTIGYFLFIPVLRYFGFWRKESYFQSAEKVGRHFPQLKDDLLNAMQLLSESRNRKIYSSGLIDAAFKNIYERSKNISFESIVNFKKAKSFLIYVAVIIFLTAGLFSFVPGLRGASYRLINYNKEFIEPPKFSFNVSPGNVEITKGDDVLISVTVNGDLPAELFVGIKREEQAEYELKKISKDSSGYFNLEMSSVRSSFNYFATADDIQSDEFIVKVVDRPIVKTLDVEITPPAYSGLNKIFQKDNGNVTSLVGTKVSIDLSSTKMLNSAYLEFDYSTKTTLDVSGNKATGKFVIRKDNNYKIRLVDKSNNINLSPITYQVHALLDDYPSIEMIAPNMNIPLANDNRVNLIAKILDDYGFTKLILYYRLSASRYESPWKKFKQVEIAIDKKVKENDVNYIWNLSQLSPAVDDVISYYLEVFDNDNINGPKSAKTSVFTVRVPSLEEILADADQVHKESETELEQTLKEAEELDKTLKDIDQELKKDQKKLSWEEKEKIENALEKFEQLQEKVTDVGEKLQEMQNKLQENDLLSEETLEKYMELQKLMDQLTSEEMKKAMEQLQNMLQKLNREMTQQAMEKLKFDEEMFKKSVERTLNLLKKIQIEQKVDELIKRTEELSKEQNDLKEQTENSDLSSKENQNELSKKQNEISKKLDDLSEEMKNLDKKMDEVEDTPQEEFEKMMEDFEKQKNQEKSEQASKNIQQNQKQNAMQQQQQLSNNMSRLNQQLQDMKNSMMMQNQMQTFTDMMKILDNLLTLSKKQEELKNETQNSDPNSSSFKRNSEQQSNLLQNLANIMGQMSELSQKTFAITPEMGKELGDANKSMQQSIQSMQNRNGAFAAITQGEAMMHLNKAASMMKGMMEAMMQGGGQGGMMSMMQQLQQMAQQQMSLNNLTQMLQQMQQGKLSQQQQAQLQRLAQQQDLIRKSLQQLNEEAKVSGESKKLPTNLDNVLKEMQEVITNMQTDKLDDKLVQKQEHILSKLLDAQRSINERDFEKERKSQTGKNYVRTSPGDISLSKEENRKKIIDELKRVMGEGYTKDYEELILKYYEALQKENTSE